MTSTQITNYFLILVVVLPINREQRSEGQLIFAEGEACGVEKGGMGRKKVI